MDPDNELKFNDLLKKIDIDPSSVAILRHGFSDPGKHRTLLRVASECPDLFDAFQSVQDATVEGAMERLNGNGFVAAFVGISPGKALFVGLFRVADSVLMRPDDIYALSAYQELDKIKLMTRAEYQNEFHRKFSMEPVEAFAAWKGRLLVKWPPPERSWYRKAANNSMPVIAIHENSLMDIPMPNWSDLSLAWHELDRLPRAWKDALIHWRGIYYIHDESDGRGYVGSAYGAENLLGRWKDYAATGHGGNKLLRTRKPDNFRYSILERLSPDAKPELVVQAESSWKVRLCTRGPHGLNDN